MKYFNSIAIKLCYPVEWELANVLNLGSHNNGQGYPLNSVWQGLSTVAQCLSKLFPDGLMGEEDKDNAE